MPAAILAFAGVVLAIAAIVLLPKASAAKSKAETLARCSALRARLEGERVQGGNPILAAQIEAELNACIDDARAQGIDIDPSESVLDALKFAATQIAQEWQHYQSTGGEDAVARNNIRAAILKAGATMVTGIRSAVAGASTLPMLSQIEAFAREQALQSKMRATCYLDGTAGCSRYGVNEAHVNSKATDELMRIGFPLGVLPLYGDFWESYRRINGNHLDVTMATAISASQNNVMDAIRERRKALTPVQVSQGGTVRDGNYTARANAPAPSASTTVESNSVNIGRPTRAAAGGR